MKRPFIAYKEFVALVLIVTLAWAAINVWIYPECGSEDEWGVCVKNYIFSSKSNDEFTDPVEARLKAKMIDNRGGQRGPWAFKKLNKQGDLSEGQAAAIMKHLKNKTNGTYFEAGAHDGEFLSNTLALEYHHGWTGILVEPQPNLYQELVSKNRKAITLNGCISPSAEAVNVTMQVTQIGEDWRKGTGSIDGFDHPVLGANIMNISVECFPLMSILNAAGSRKIDAFSLDVQGAEMKILGSLPWEQVDITLLVVENDTPDAGKRDQVFKAMTSFLATKGYNFIERVSNDYLYMKNFTATA